MLRLKKITKTYNIASGNVLALKGIDLSFRKNEFVSILGPSGCGKTTTLNIIGGLDNYTSGDLIIEGTSTKDFKDKDWDLYRNTRIGFVFQSYNLIPHQTILGNVELALTISGLSKDERIKRAKEALDKVGLKGSYNKKPNQLSGGQCQRVAIARAIVNEPDILLADEPTGALDTKTSVQIMEIIKEISKDKLVIMVTHNPDLANKYSTRIINLLDGEVLDDSNPFSEEDEIKECEELKNTLKNEKNVKKAKMSFFTAFKLSAKNLWSKRKRTIMTMIAGSIGIIGISAVLAVSNGVKSYIKDMQDDMLSGNPIEIVESGTDYSALLNMVSSGNTEIVSEFLEGNVSVDKQLEMLASTLNQLSNATFTNNITEDYINYVKAMPEEYYATMSMEYGINYENNLYTEFDSEGNKSTISLTTINKIYIALLNEQSDFSQYSSYILSLSDVISQMPEDTSYVETQYDVVYGKMPENKNDVVLVIDSNSALTDLTLARLGYFTQDEFLAIAKNTFAEIEAEENGTTATVKDTKEHFTYEELTSKVFYYEPNDNIYSVNEIEGNTIISYQTTCDTSLSGTEKLNVVGILKPKDGVNYGCLGTGLYYTQDLALSTIKDNKDSAIVNYLSTLSSPVIQTLSSYTGLINFNFSYTYTTDEEGQKEYNSTDYFTLSLREAGGLDLPSTIKIYPNSFDDKYLVTDYLDVWNSEDTITLDGKEILSSDRIDVKYTDNLELIISIINTMINMITIALICFTALSLVVSCVMIAIITYVSVVERVKEIGVIRSLGGRKKDVSNLFNAETLIIGALAGLFGILFTYIISLIVNLLTKGIIGFNIASLPISNALIMILLSIVLTVISGFIPAKKAAKQDPVVALRSE